MPIFILRLSCPDQKGVVASISQGLVELDANILQNAEFSDPATVTFCMRTRFETDTFEASTLEDALRPRAEALGAKKLYLLTNHASAAAIHLYEKLGFEHDAGIMAEYGTRYERCDVAMLYRSR